MYVIGQYLTFQWFTYGFTTSNQNQSYNTKLKVEIAIRILFELLHQNDENQIIFSDESKFDFKFTIAKRGLKCVYTIANCQ